MTASDDKGAIAPRVYRQSTFEEIIESEREMVIAAEERYGKYYTNANRCSVYLSQCVAGIDHDRIMFGHFLSLLKKHHLLALLSIIRLHKVQAMMNLRQVLEAGATAAFAIANPAQEHFAETDEQGLLGSTPKLAKKRYGWLHEHYREKSDWIRQSKERINLSAAHANIVSSASTFRLGEKGDAAETPFFDIEDGYYVKVDLWQSASIALSLMDLFYGINQKLAVIEFIPGFEQSLDRFAGQTDLLLAELKATDRYKRIFARLGLPED